MEYEEAVQKLAPCGLDCSRCADYVGSEIRNLSARLSELLTGYKRVADIRAGKNPNYRKFSDFTEMLGLLSQGSCGGCRSEDVRCPVKCKAKLCHKDKKVDFCFECGEYPCAEQAESVVGKRWREKNDLMKEMGVVRFYEYQLKLPRY